MLEAWMGKAAIYAVKGSGAGVNVIRDLMIVLLGIEAGAAGDHRDAYWLQLQITKTDGTVLTATLLADDPYLAPSHTPRTGVLRYIYQEGDTRPLEYVNAIRGGAVTSDFGLMTNLMPVFDEGDLEHELFPERGRFLGLPIQRTGTRKIDASVPADPRVLELDPELIIGTGRNTRDVEEQRIWTGDEYTYRKFTAADYDEMIEAGMNYFWVDDQQEQWVWRRPVFYLKWAGAARPYPEMFYRANCRGITMFMDEPAIHLGWYFEEHPEVAKALAGPAGAARMLEERVAADHLDGRYSRRRLNAQLRKTFDLGDWIVEETRYPAWETQEWSAYYQLKAGMPGIVHEGRYTTQADVNVINADYDALIPDTPVNNFRIRYAWFRGAARAFHGDWGTAIYGHCERAIAPLAMTMAYDMGARYVWFWTSDRLHHMPYPEQLALARHLRDYASAHPRTALDELRRSARAAIVLPDGYPLAPYAMWGTQVFHLDRVNEHGVRYRDVLHPAALQVERYIKQEVPFDFLYDDEASDWRQYNEAVVVSDDGTAQLYRKGEPAGTPPPPPRTDAERSLLAPTISIRVETPDATDPMTVRLSAEIDNHGRPAGLRSRDWGTPNWTYMEAIWHVYEDPDDPTFYVGRNVSHTFDRSGTYRVTAWTCNEYGVAGRAAIELRVTATATKAASGQK